MDMLFTKGYGCLLTTYIYSAGRYGSDYSLRHYKNVLYSAISYLELDAHAPTVSSNFILSPTTQIPVFLPMCNHLSFASGINWNMHHDS